MKELFDSPCKIINLEKNKKRWETSKKRIEEAGFKNIERFDAIGPDRLKEKWQELNNPTFAHNKDVFFQRVLGKQGCFLSHILIWKDIIENNIPITTIFEDDVLFHPLWHNIAPKYFEMTPTDYDILYLGSQFQKVSIYHIDKVPVYCTHAYTITFKGAKKLYNLILNNPEGVYTIDGMLLELMYKDAFYWCVWNASSFYPSKHITDSKWKERNNGLVYQDDAFETDIIL
jgi:GR25 family glycosyltransferase involved in LPS biosynthesis